MSQPPGISRHSDVLPYVRYDIACRYAPGVAQSTVRYKCPEDVKARVWRVKRNETRWVCWRRERTSAQTADMSQMSPHQVHVRGRRCDQRRSMSRRNEWLRWGRQKVLSLVGRMKKNAKRPASIVQRENRGPARRRIDNDVAVLQREVIRARAVKNPMSIRRQWQEAWRR